MPSSIMLNEGGDRVCLLTFCKNGRQHDSEGLPGYIWINEDGSTEDEEGHPINVDLSRFGGSPPRPPTMITPPHLTRD